MRKMVYLFIALVCASIGYWDFGRATAQDLDPIKVAGDTHKLVLENALVRVFEIHLPVGKIEPMHQHGHGVAIYLSDFKVRITEQGTEPREVERKRGQIRWREKTIHSVVNTGNTEGHVINVELK